MLVDPERLASYGVALNAVEETLRRASRNTSAGFRLAGGQEYLIQGAGRVRDIDGIGATVITTRDTQPIRVRDVAELRVGESLKRGDGSRNGRPAVILGVHRQPDVNTLALTRDVETVLGELQAELPDGMQLDAHLFRQADFIELALDNLNAALRDGTLLVVLVTLLFLANLRASAITLVAIPLSLLAAVAGLRAAGTVDQQHDARRDGHRGRGARRRRHRRRGERGAATPRERRPPGSAAATGAGSGLSRQPRDPRLDCRCHVHQ